MRLLVLPFAALSILGLVLSTWVHVAAIAAWTIPAPAWVLHVGIFVVFPPAIIATQASGLGAPLGATRQEMRAAAWRRWTELPVAIRLPLYALFVYAFVNFFWMSATMPQPSPDPAIALRMFSGHWMVFYYAAFAMFYRVLTVGRLMG